MYKLLPVTTQTEFCRLYYKYILTCKYLPLWNKRIVLYFQDKKRYQFVNSNWHLAKKFSKYRFWEMMCSTNLTLWQAHNYTLLSCTVWWNHVQRSKLCYIANLMAMKFKYMCATIKIFNMAALFAQRGFSQESEVLLGSMQCAVWENFIFQRLCKLNKWWFKTKTNQCNSQKCDIFFCLSQLNFKKLYENRYLCTCSLYTKKLTSVQEVVILLIHTTLCK